MVGGSGTTTVVLVAVGGGAVVVVGASVDVVVGATVSVERLASRVDLVSASTPSAAKRDRPEPPGGFQCPPRGAGRRGEAELLSGRWTPRLRPALTPHDLGPWRPPSVYRRPPSSRSASPRLRTHPDRPVCGRVRNPDRRSSHSGRRVRLWPLTAAAGTRSEGSTRPTAAISTLSAIPGVRRPVDGRSRLRCTAQAGASPSVTSSRAGKSWPHWVQRPRGALSAELGPQLVDRQRSSWASSVQVVDDEAEHLLNIVHAAPGR